MNLVEMEILSFYEKEMERRRKHREEYDRLVQRNNLKSELIYYVNSEKLRPSYTDFERVLNSLASGEITLERAKEILKEKSS